MNKLDLINLYIYHVHIIPTSTDKKRIWVRWSWSGPQKDNIFDIDGDDVLYLDRTEESLRELAMIKITQLMKEE